MLNRLLIKGLCGQSSRDGLSYVPTLHHGKPPCAKQKTPVISLMTGVLNIEVPCCPRGTVFLPALIHPSIGVKAGKHEVHAEVREYDRKEANTGDDRHLRPFPAADVA